VKCLLAFFCFFVFFSLDLTARIYSYETPVANYLKDIEITEFNSNLEGVDCIYVINLDERIQKWKRMKKLFKQQGLHINRVSGINGWRLPKQVQKELAGSYPLRMSGGQIGCLLSHISVVRDAYRRGFDLIWVLEDDVEFTGDVNHLPALLSNLSEIDPDWDVFYTDVDSKNDKGEYVPSLASDFRPDQSYFPLSYYTKRTQAGREIMKIGQRFGMYSLFISRKGIKKILDYFTHVYVWAAVDIDIHYIPNINEYSAMRDIVSIHSRSISDTTFDNLSSDGH